MLRHAGMGLFYAGRKHWVGDAGSAMDLESIERAAEISREEEFESVEVFVTFGDPLCELVLPLKRGRAKT